MIHAKGILFPGSTDFTMAIFKIPEISKHFSAMLGTEITSKSTSSMGVASYGIWQALLFSSFAANVFNGFSFVVES